MSDLTFTPPTHDDDLVRRDRFEKTAIWLPAYAVAHINAGLRQIEGKTFIDCIFDGPALLVAGENVTFESCNLGIAKDMQNLLVQPLGVSVAGGIGFSNTRFTRCRFMAVSFTGHPDFLLSMAKGPLGLREETKA